MARNAKKLDEATLLSIRNRLDSAPDPVSVIWADHSTVSDGWTDLLESLSRAEMPGWDYVMSVGFLVEETDDYILIAQSLDPVKLQADACLKVLKPCVLQLQHLPRLTLNVNKKRKKKSN